MTESPVSKLPIKIRWQTLVYAAGTLLILSVLLLATLGYTMAGSATPLAPILKRLPLPIAFIGAEHVVTLRALEGNTAAIRRFYEEQDFSQIGLRVDFSTEEGKKRLKVREKEVFNTMVEDAAIKRLAEEKGIHVTSEMAEDGIQRKLEEYGSAEMVQANLERLYGWSLEDFKEKIVLPSLYEEKLVAYFEKDNESNAQAKSRIEKAQAAIEKKETFAAVAKEYSEGGTADEGGKLGWFALPDLAPELQSAVTGQKVGVVGEVVESRLGYHIVLVEEKRTENEQELYRLSQIFTKKALFADWLTAEMKKMPIRVFSPEYQFNKSTARIEFKDASLEEFEEKLREQSGGDATFFF